MQGRAVGRTGVQGASAGGDVSVQTGSGAVASGKLSLQGDRAVLTLNGAQGPDIAQWLAEARRGARARPVESRLTNGGDGYDGTIVVAIGGKP